jgi:GTPase
MSTPYNEALGATLIERTKREQIVLVGVTLAGHHDDDTDASLDELALLIDTAGADEAGRLSQRRDTPDHTWYIGKGKVDELKDMCLAVDADTVVFDNELAPAQQYNLEKVLGRTAIDRTAVILDIFAQNAHTLEGKAQVELALLRYRLPRLRRGATAKLSQQRGGVGSRFGSGETKLEVDRRRIKGRISKLEGDLKDLSATRDLQRKSRSRSGLAAVTIVGYTNAGKSTLLNHLTKAGVLVEDRLFATLDPTTRRLALPGGEPVLITDTVGFVRRLPHGLIEAFKSTLEVASRGDYLVQSSTARRPIRRARSTLCATCWPRSARCTCPSCWCSTSVTWHPTWPTIWCVATKVRCRSAHGREKVSTDSSTPSATACVR